MSINLTRCYRCVGEIKNMIKYGKTKSGNQRFVCRLCRKTRVESYTYQAYKPDIDESIIQLTKEGLGIRSTARILKIPDGAGLSTKGLRLLWFLQIKIHKFLIIFLRIIQ